MTSPIEPEQTAIESEQIAQLGACVANGGVAVFPSDTVYGLCCDPDSESAVRRMYELKGRPAARPAAVMFFALEPALATLEELTVLERAAMETLLPGPVTLLLPNCSRRFALACAGDIATLGLRVPRLPEHLQALREMVAPVMQSSANRSGQPDARTLAEVPLSLREGADLVLDGGQLPGRPSTVVDLRDFHQERHWRVLREGALSAGEVAAALAPLLAS